MKVYKRTSIIMVPEEFLRLMEERQERVLSLVEKRSSSKTKNFFTEKGPWSYDSFFKLLSFESKSPYWYVAFSISLVNSSEISISFLPISSKAVAST